MVEFSVSGNGTIVGTDNGYQADTISLKSNKRKCWKGLALAIVRSSAKKGTIAIRASSNGLQTAHLILQTN
jgi:beta-galactosidase